MTELQLRALDFIREQLTSLGFSPSYDEIGDHLGIKGRGGVKRLIDCLVEQGLIRRTPAKPRSLSLPDQPVLCRVPTEALKDELARRGVTLDALTYSPRLGEGRRDDRRRYSPDVTCAADSCGILVQRGHLFCRDHWWGLPRELREGILAAFRAKDVARYQELVSEARDLADRGIAA